VVLEYFVTAERQIAVMTVESLVVHRRVPFVLFECVPAGKITTADNTVPVFHCGEDCSLLFVRSKVGNSSRNNKGVSLIVKRLGLCCATENIHGSNAQQHIADGNAGRFYNTPSEILRLVCMLCTVVVGPEHEVTAQQDDPALRSTRTQGLALEYESQIQLLVLLQIC
jgi:hypothetical protein